jgi:tetratricopeptide (TPR) repeat protein
MNLRRLIPFLVLILLMTMTQVSAREAVLGLSERVYKVINEVQELLEEERLDEAMRLLEQAQERHLSSYETTQVLRMVGLIHYEAGRLEQARSAFEESLAQRRIPEALAADLLGILARLGLMLDDNVYAEAKLRELLLIPGHDTPENQVLFASACLRQDNYQEAIIALTQAIDRERLDQEIPPENWLSMLASAYHATEEYERMRLVVRQLIELYPREQYLMNLAALHGQLGDQKSQLALIEALLEVDAIRQPAYRRNLISLLLAQELPYKAAVILEGFLDSGALEADEKTLEQLSQAWYLAQEHERAIKPLMQAAQGAESGELYLRVAGLHMDAYQWREAVDRAGDALDKGGLNEEGRAWLVQGMAYVRMDELDAADRSFSRAAEFVETERYARQWLAYVANERNIRDAAAGDD